MSNNPCSRQHSSLCESNKVKEVIMFGGVSMPQNSLLNDTWLFNYSQIDFNTKLPDVVGAVYTQLSTKGEQPSPRYGHKSIYLKDSLLVFGGKTSDKIQNFNMYSLNLLTLSWTKIHSIGLNPQSRSHFSISYLDSNHILLFGGKCNLTN